MLDVALIVELSISVELHCTAVVILLLPLYEMKNLCNDSMNVM